MVISADTERWQLLEEKLSPKLGDSFTMADILLFIGIRESGLPAKQFSEKEKNDLIEMAICTILVPARYYELFWVEDTGWPHYKQLQRLPEMSEEGKEQLFKKYILIYSDKNRLI